MSYSRHIVLARYAAVRTSKWKPFPGDVVQGCEVFNYQSVSSTTSEVVKLGLIRVVDSTRLLGGLWFNLDNPVHWGLQKIRKIHGQFPQPLPEGYAFRLVPYNVQVTSRHGSKIHLAKSSHHVKSLAAIIQLLFACVTL